MLKLNEKLVGKWVIMEDKDPSGWWATYEPELVDHPQFGLVINFTDQLLCTIDGKVLDWEKLFNKPILKDDAPLSYSWIKNIEVV